MTGKCDLITCYECFFVDLSQYGGDFAKDFHFKSDDRLISTVSAATCLDKGLGLGGNSLSVGTFVEG